MLTSLLVAKRSAVGYDRTRTDRTRGGAIDNYHARDNLSPRNRDVYNRTGDELTCGGTSVADSNPASQLLGCVP